MATQEVYLGGIVAKAKYRMDVTSSKKRMTQEDQEQALKKASDEICERIVGGVYPQTAALDLGITQRQFFHWMRLGRSGTHPFVMFYEAIRKAEAKAETDLLTQMLLSPEGWQRFAWVLERRFPQRWAQQKFHDGRVPSEDVVIAAIPVILETLGHDAVLELIEQHRDNKADINTPSLPADAGGGS